MANDLVTIQRWAKWVEAHADTAGATLLAGLKLTEALIPIANKRGGTDKQAVSIKRIFTGIPAADRAIAESAGVAEIAGEAGVSIEDVIDFTKLLIGAAVTFA